MTLTSTPETSERPPNEPPERSAPKGIKMTPAAWIKKNLFDGWFNSLLTVVTLLVLGIGFFNLFRWAFTAEWIVVSDNLGLYMSGLYRPEMYWRIWTAFAIVAALAGLTWGLLARNQQTLFGRNVLIGIGAIALFIILWPVTRPHALLILGVEALIVAMAVAGQALGRNVPSSSTWMSGLWFASYFVVLFLLGGGELRASLFYGLIMIGGGILVGQQLAKRITIPRIPGIFSDIILFVVGFIVTYQLLWRLPYWIGFDFGLRNASTANWGGLTLTLLLAVSGIVLCFPLGVILALGRRSKLPVFSGLSVAYIELIRGVPLISILFMGQVLIPLFLPEGVRPDRVVRAIIGLTIFSSAYLAENVRAGLQAVPQGQTEAAQSLGLNKPLTMALIVMPQALKVAIPAIVGQFISLFQDTTLLGIVGLVELLGITKGLLANTKYLGDFAQAYLFIATMYWVFCYAMSFGSRKIEAALNTDLR
ncbi:MAG: amino acid ABC transporter permease [Phormidesmis sp.]